MQKNIDTNLRMTLLDIFFTITSFQFGICYLSLLLILLL